MSFETYSVQLLPSAQKELDQIPERIRINILSRIKMFPDNPRPRQCTKLKGTTDVFRIRVGDYRIIYRVRDNIKLVSVGHVLHRSKAYK